MGWTRGKNGTGAIDEESGCAWSVGENEKRKSETEL